MNIFELFDPSPDYDGYQTEKQDNSVLKLNDLRKTRLSLDQINRMRIMNDVRTLEHEKKLKQVSKQYKSAGEGGTGTGMPAGI
jgi:hypothetical protein